MDGSSQIVADIKKKYSQKTGNSSKENQESEFESNHQNHSVSLLKNVEKTLLTPLAARAIGHQEGKIVDPMSAEIVAKIGLNANEFVGGERTVTSIVARTRAFDAREAKFLKQHREKHPFCIHLGAGFDTRHVRLSEGFPEGKWLDIDFPDVIAIKSQVTPETGQYFKSAQDIIENDFGWLENLEQYGLKNGDPIMITAEGLLMYFEPEKVERFFKRIAERFHDKNKVIIVFDTFHKIYISVDKFKHYSKMLKIIQGLTPKNISDSAAFNWGIKKTADLLDYDNRYEITHYEDIGLELTAPKIAKVFEFITGSKFYSLVELQIK